MSIWVASKGLLLSTFVYAYLYTYLIFSVLNTHLCTPLLYPLSRYETGFSDKWPLPLPPEKSIKRNGHETICMGKLLLTAFIRPGMGTENKD